MNVDEKHDKQLMRQGVGMAALADEITYSDALSGQAYPSTEKLGQPIPPPRGPNEDMRLVASRGPDKGAEFALSMPLTLIGRLRDCDVVVDDVTVSRYHAELEVFGGHCFLTDCGSLNGTFVNRQPVESVELVEGDEIWIGKARFTFRTGATSGDGIVAQR